MSGILDPRILPFRNSGCNSSSISALSNSSVCLCVHYLSFQWILVGLRVLHGSKCTLLMAFFSLSHLGYFSHRRGCLLVLIWGQAEGQACTDPGVRTPIVRRKKYLFYALYSLIFILQTMFL
jgi:hypothetical protein